MAKTRVGGKVPMNELIEISRPCVILVRRLNQLLRERPSS